MLERVVKQTDNDLDDLAVKHLKDLLFTDFSRRQIAATISVRHDWRVSCCLVLQYSVIWPLLCYCRFSSFSVVRPTSWLLLNSLKSRCRLNYWRSTRLIGFRRGRKVAIDQQIYMPYFRQLDNKTGTGYRECFSSAAAMVAAYYKKVRTDDEYNEIRAKYGDTTSVEAQLAALRSLGLKR